MKNESDEDLRSMNRGTQLKPGGSYRWEYIIVLSH
jgi:hypothetical protein